MQSTYFFTKSWYVIVTGQSSLNETFSMSHLCFFTIVGVKLNMKYLLLKVKIVDTVLSVLPEIIFSASPTAGNILVEIWSVLTAAYSLNQCVRNICLKLQDVLKDFHLMEIDKYLKMHLKSNLFFYYSKEENKILVTIDSPE